MKKISFTALFLFIFLIAGFSQEKIEQAQHWFTAEDGTFYFNRTQPLYIWLATSPDNNSNDVLLKSEKLPQYSNPLYLDQDGYNSFRSARAVDTTTRKIVYPSHEVKFEIQTDGSPPKTKAKFTGANKYLKNSKIFYGKGLEIVLSAKDEIAGVAKTYYSINNGAYQEYNTPIEFEDENMNATLKFYSTDNTGNSEEIHEYNFAVDLSAPIISQQINGEQHGNILSQDATISLLSEDNISGVKNTYYMIDDGKPILYTKPISAYSFFGGEHTLTFYSIDNVQNNSIGSNNEQVGSEFAIRFTVDKSAPTIDIEFIGDQYKGKQLYISERTKFKLTATDNMSDIDFIKYSNSSDGYQKYSEPTTFPNKSGYHSINFYTQDIIGNKSSIHKTIVYLDNNEPSSYIDYGSPKFFHRDTLFITNSTPIKIISKDDVTGVAKTEYSIDDGTYTEYTNSINCTEPGFHKISFKATDRVNNTEQIKESSFYIDNYPPDIYVNFSIQPIRHETKNGKSYPVYPTYTKMYLSATDKNTGEEEIFYSINGSKLNKYYGAENIAKAKLLSKEQFYTVKIVAKDKVGNKSEKIINFFIAKK